MDGRDEKARRRGDGGGGGGRGGGGGGGGARSWRSSAVGPSSWSHRKLSR